MAMLFPPKLSTESQDLSIREVGKKFLEELKAQGPTLDRVGKVFLKFIKKRDYQASPHPPSKSSIIQTYGPQNRVRVKCESAENSLCYT